MRSIGTGILFLLFCLAAPVISKTVYLNVGASFQDSVNANVAGTTYIIRSGVHRLQSVAPKNNDVYIGETGAVMNGARLLTQWTQSGAYWVCTDQTQSGQVHGECDDSFPGCKYPEDLYKDDVIMKHETTLVAVQTGEYYFDYANDRIYIIDNPTGRKLEVCTARKAFGSSASNVTVKRLIVEKYAIPAQMGAIGDQYPGPGWVVDSCESRFNHGVGITVGNHGIVRHCYVHHNGQQGFGAGNTVGALFEHNETAYNRTAGINWGWEGGGAKFGRTDSLVLRNNYAHHNNGPGLWTDVYCRNTLYEGNICDSNGYAGIFHEISYEAIIRCNLLRGNNFNRGYSWLWHGQILISTSQDVEVYNNIVVVAPQGGDGICITNQQRSPAYSRNNYVHDNDITHLGGGSNGAVTDFDNANFWATANNRFDYNRYHRATSTGNYWAWKDRDYTWSDFRGVGGQEAHGTLDNNLQSHPVFALCADLSTAIQRPCHEGAKGAADSRVLPTLTVSERLGNISLVVGLDRPQTGRIAIYDVRGKMIALLANGMLGSGQVRLQKQGLPNGVYLVRLVTPGFSIAKRVVITR